MAVKTTKTGIVGAGFISEFHIRALRECPGIEIAGICDLNVERARKLAHTWGIAGAYGSIQELAERTQLDAVHVVTAPLGHEESMRWCMENGIATFVEKPVVTNVVECQSALATERRTGSYVGVNHNAVFHPAFRRLMRLIRERTLGAVEHVISCVNVPLRQLSAGQHGHWMFKAPGNILLEQGPHPISQIFSLLGKAARISALQTGERRLNNGALFFDTWEVSLACERGTAQGHFAFGKEFLENWLYVVGQDGSVFVDLRRNTIRRLGKSRFVDPAANTLGALSNALQEARQGVRSFMDYGLGFLKLRPSADPFYCSLRDSVHAFHDAYRKGVRPPVTLSDGCDVVETCERIAELASERTAVHAR
jgi:predicted dehydrogenase